MKQYKIYQLPIENNAKFMALEFVTEHNIMPTLNDYECVYECELDPRGHETDVYKVLDNIFRIFNINHPEDFHGHSLSVSDVVEIDGEFYYCDDFGWEKLDWSAPSEDKELTLFSPDIHFARNGDLLYHTTKIGTWRKQDIWKEYGGKYDRSGNRLVPYLYWITIPSHSAEEIPFYSRAEVREFLNGKKVKTI